MRTGGCYLLLLLLLPAMGHAQRQAAKERNWEFHAGAWLLWNTVHGDRSWTLLFSIAYWWPGTTLEPRHE